MKNTKASFYNMLIKNGDCIEWKGLKNKNGYGRTFYNNKPWLAHRLALEFEGIQTAKKVVMHLCDNPSCCNTAHLSVGTQADNMKDMRNKNRDSKPPLLNGTKHPKSKLTDDNVEQILKELSHGFTQTSIAKKYGVNRSLISAIKDGRKWKHIPRNCNNS